EDLRHYFPDLNTQVKIIPLGSDHLLPLADAGQEADDLRPYFLSVGTREPRKNRLGLLKAFEAVAAEADALELVVVGRPGWMDNAFDEALAVSPVRDRVRMLEGVDDRELAAFYTNAVALVYPSLGEGFGLPVTEAMALGCPVITSDVTSLPQVAGGAAMLVNPSEVPSLADAMRKMASDPALRRSYAMAGKKRAAALTWKGAAADTLNLFRTLTGLADRNRGKS
ncbi:MAG: glycosyltransferase family 1 protein, partial [Planctomycetota bacterium]